MSAQVFDVAIIGGGLAGTAAARDAAGRGLSVFLAEALDIAEGSSSATGDVVWGPLDDAGRFAVGRMRANAAEAAVLANIAPHLVRPARFMLPAPGGIWPGLRLRLQLFAVDRTSHAEARAGRIQLDGKQERGLLGGAAGVAHTWSDWLADDSRLAVLHAVDARYRGAAIRPRLRCTVAEREGDHWRLSLETTTGEPLVIEARALINAAGAAVAAVNDHVIHTERRFGVHLVKRSFLIVRRALPEGVAHAFPRGDGSLLYAVPMAGDHTLLGPRTVAYAGEDATLGIEESDLAELLTVPSRHLSTPLRGDDVVSGLTALWAFPAKGRRVWSLEVDSPPRQPPVVSIVGATLINHRRMAEEAVSAIAGAFAKAGPPWTAHAALPGGAFPAGGIADVVRALGAAYRFLPEAQVQRLARAYGTRAHEILIGCRIPADLGRRFGADLTEVEVSYLRREEFAETAADILWRRTKLGFHMSAVDAAELDAWLKRHRVAAPGPVMPP